MQKEIKKQIEICKVKVEIAIIVRGYLDSIKREEENQIKGPLAPVIISDGTASKVIIGDNPDLQEAYIYYHKEELDSIPDTISDYISKFLRILR